MEIVERKISKAIDGDTFRVLTPVWGSRNIRIADFNSPESGQRGYLESKIKLQKFAGKKVEIIPVAKSYGRTVAKVFYNEEYLTKFL